MTVDVLDAMYSAAYEMRYSFMWLGAFLTIAKVYDLGYRAGLRKRDRQRQPPLWGVTDPKGERLCVVRGWNYKDAAKNFKKYARYPSGVEFDPADCDFYPPKDYQGYYPKRKVRPKEVKIWHSLLERMGLRKK